MRHSLSVVAALCLGACMGQAQADDTPRLPLDLKTDSAQAGAGGFFDDQHLSGSTRNWYAREHSSRDALWRYTQGDGSRRSTHSRTNWVQGTVLDYSSGFTEGTVGVAVQAALYNAVALERGRARVAGPNNRTLTHRNGEALDQWSKAGLANVKLRASNTTLTAGRQAINTPVLATLGNRALPSSFQGISLNSSEFEQLSFELGTFDRVSPRTEQSLSTFRSEYAAVSAESDRISLFGVNYRPSAFLNTSLFAAKVDDFWNQYYADASHSLTDGEDWSLVTTVKYYKTVDEGRRLLGPIDNDTYSLDFSLAYQAHTFGLAWQQVLGDEYFDYLHESNGIYLANSLFSDYNGPNEKSLQLSYALDMAPYGVPGLKLNLYTARGWGIDGTHYKGTGYDVRGLDGEHHAEWSVGATYAVQSGALKNATVRATYTAHRASRAQADGSLDEFRVVTTIPLDIL
ncbi:OprD family porin [Pseudomonas entomophila]|uniref:OprD family porin n=1 Tax=Pseudomonas entomophila TaxID=312306 RepID=UPI0015E43CF2|nr:OprD family porin [Pseudomonas entomophila]MBA1188593.1 OprD family porin [Pseudomonas entomophila]